MKRFTHIAQTAEHKDMAHVAGQRWNECKFMDTLDAALKDNAPKKMWIIDISPACFFIKLNDSYIKVKPNMAHGFELFVENRKSTEQTYEDGETLSKWLREEVTL